MSRVCDNSFLFYGLKHLSSSILSPKMHILCFPNSILETHFPRIEVCELKLNELDVNICLFKFFFGWFLAAVFNKEDDIATFTIRAVDDPRTLNKILYVRPPKNTYTFNQLAAVWEKKIGKTLEKIYVPEEKVLKDIQGQ